MNNILIKRIEELYILRIERKTGWGRNELLTEYKLAVREALHEVNTYKKPSELVNTELVLEIGHVFKDNLNTQTGWGKNIAILIFTRSILQALLNKFKFDNVQD
jgi:hypothetical protein